MTLNQLYKIFANHPEGTWIMQWPNAVQLYDFIKSHSFKKILTLGTGIGFSDAVIALAMKDKGETEYHIDSVEQYDKCVALAQEIIPPELKEHITIIKSEVTATLLNGIPYQYFSVYKDLPEGDYNLIVNDGPAPFIENSQYIDLPNGVIHALTIEDKLKPGTIVMYDGRIQSLNLLERYFSDNFYLKVVAHRGDFNVLERKDNPINIRDEKFEVMKQQTTYFNNNEDTVPGDKQDTSSTPANPSEGT